MSKAWGVTSFSDAVVFSFDWKIVDFSRCMKTHRQRIESPSLAIPGTGGLVCHLVCTHYNLKVPGVVTKIQVNGWEEVMEEANLFTVALEFETGVEIVELAGFVDVQCGENSLLRGKFGDHTQDQYITKTHLGNNMYGWSLVPPAIKFFSSSYNVYQSYSGFYHPSKLNSPVDIKLSLFSTGEVTNTLYMGPPPPKKIDSSELVSDMKSLMLDPKHSDVVLKCQSEQLLCHKSVLGARSAVFGRMFDANFKESTSGVVEIDDVEPEVLKVMVEYIYTGKDVTEQLDDLVKLVYVGDKYELKGLIDFCYQKFSSDKDDIQLVEMLIMADMHSLDKFKDMAIRRIVMDKVKFTKDKDFLIKMESYPKLLIELFNA